MEIVISQSLGGIFMNECAFSTKDPTYLDYHDNVWGQPIYDSKALFKLMALESQHRIILANHFKRNNLTNRHFTTLSQAKLLRCLRKI